MFLVGYERKNRLSTALRWFEVCSRSIVGKIDAVRLAPLYWPLIHRSMKISSNDLLSEGRGFRGTIGQSPVK